MAQPYGYVSTGTSNQRSPWQARQTRQTSTAPKKADDPWAALSSWTSGTKAAEMPTFTFPTTPTTPTTTPTTPSTGVSPTYTSGTPSSTTGAITKGPTWLNLDWSNLSAPDTKLGAIDPKAGIQQWLSAMTPYLQTMQNAYQYAQDYNEAQRRYDITQKWTMSNDQFNQGITGRQQNAAEWQATETARQWQATQDYQRQRDAAEMALTNRQAMNTVWGRNVAPQTRWMRSW